MTDQKNKNKKNDEDVFQNPCLLIQRMDCSDKPRRDARRGQSRYNFLLFAHGNDLA